MTLGIHELNVEYADKRQQLIRGLQVAFADGHRLHLVARDETCTLSLVANSQEVKIDAGGPMCQFEQAVNILRLHLR